MNTEKLVAEVKAIKEVVAPVWTPFVKTGVSKERPPMNPDWWFVRTASILCKIKKYGPIGTNGLAKQYGGRKDRGHKPNKKASGSRNITRKCVQQLEAAGLVKQITSPKAGKVISKEGNEFLKRFM